MKILIKGGKIVNFDEIQERDILIENSKVVRIGKNIKEEVDREINAQGKFILPGLIDIHTHLRTPGREDEEDLLSASKAAAKGGFTTIMCMPNTEPAIDNYGLAEWIVKEAEKIGMVDIYPAGAITKERKGKELTEFGALKKAGCLALSDDGNSLKDTYLLRRALEYAKMFNILIISHCEDESLSFKGSIREGFLSSKYGIRGIPSISESIVVFRDIELAGYLKTRIHLAHISTKRSIEIIKKAKEEGIKVTCETAPHYFILTVDDIKKRNFSALLKVNPPLQEKEDIEAVKKALAEDIIDCIATDHAPHSKAEKELSFGEAPFGFIGLELAFSLTYTYLVKKNILSLKDLVKKMSYTPAKILGLGDKGYIKEESPADLVIVDLESRWKVTEENLLSKSKNTPFLGYELEGEIIYTIHKGKIVYKSG
ncbi:MAG: dihydroorotase [Candidatus Omnitrophota bacterium]|nr:MAG: dihydroorotase [Candidatus Omnitrophota bacterium]